MLLMTQPLLKYIKEFIYIFFEVVSSTTDDIYKIAQSIINHKFVSCILPD